MRRSRSCSAARRAAAGSSPLAHARAALPRPHVRARRRSSPRSPPVASHRGGHRRPPPDHRGRLHDRASHPDVRRPPAFEPDGSPDPSFSGDGRARFDLGGADYAFDAAVTAQGRCRDHGATHRTRGRPHLRPSAQRPTALGCARSATTGSLVIDAGTRQPERERDRIHAARARSWSAATRSQGIARAIGACPRLTPTARSTRLRRRRHRRVRHRSRPPSR